MAAGGGGRLNLFELPSRLPLEEEIRQLLAAPGVRIERILSGGQTSPEGFWYDQKEHEWVTILEGEGEVAYPDGRRVRLKKGDTLLLPAHQKHRVSYTSTPCLWLCVFYPNSQEEPR